VATVRRGADGGIRTGRDLLPMRILDAGSTPGIDDDLVAFLLAYTAGLDLLRIHEAETALHNGDAGPRFEMWSHTDPVTVFGAAFSPIGWAEVAPTFEKLASNFSNLKLVQVGGGCRQRR
jgi:hypothetical protein